ncbi:MAG: hypothetical protein WCE68_10590 [Anaerolineales bacterium]
MKKLNRILAFILFLVICGCSSGQNRNSASSHDSIADAIKITYRKGTEVQIADPLYFSITNTSTDCISYPIDYGLKIIMEQNDKWAAVADTVVYQSQPGQNEVLLDPEGGVFSERVVVAEPDLTNITLAGPTNFQAIITGHLCNDKSVVIEKRVPFVVTP